jgi:hypothetical protein
VTLYQAADNDTDTWGETPGDVPMKPIITCPNPQSSKQVLASQRAHTYIFSGMHQHSPPLPSSDPRQDEPSRNNKSQVKYGPGGSVQPPNGDWNKVRSLRNLSLMLSVFPIYLRLRRTPDLPAV